MNLPNEEPSWKPRQRSALYEPMIDGKPKKKARSIDMVGQMPASGSKQRALLHEQSGPSLPSDT